MAKRKKKAKLYDYVVELLPCPFCGNKNLLWTGDATGTYIDCWSCFARGPRIFRKRMANGLPHGKFPAAKRFWNKRVAVNGDSGI
jgi:hypothetical protein